MGVRGHTSEAVLDGGEMGGTPVRQCWMGGRWVAHQ